MVWQSPDEWQQGFGPTPELLEQTLLRLKRWIVKGFAIDGRSPDGRRKHVFDVIARTLHNPLTAADFGPLPQGLFADADLRGL